MKTILFSLLLSCNILAHNTRKLNHEKFMLTQDDVNKQAFSLHNYYKHKSVIMWNGQTKLLRNVDYVLSDISEVTWVTVFYRGPSSPCGKRPMREGNFIKVKGLLK